MNKLEEVLPSGLFYEFMSSLQILKSCEKIFMTFRVTRCRHKIKFKEQKKRISENGRK